MKDMEGLKHVQGHATRIVQVQEHKCCEEWLRELGLLIPEERKLRRDLITLYNSLDRRLQPAGSRALFPGNSDTGQEDTALSCTRGGLGWIFRNILHKKRDWAMEWAAQGGG